MLQLTQISLNFQTSCCNLKIRGLGAKLFVALLIFLLERCTMCFSSYKNCKLKVNLWWVEARERKKTVFFVNVYVVRRNYFQHFCFILIYSILNNLSEYIYRLLHIKKHCFIHFCCLVLKSSKALSVSWSSHRRCSVKKGCF